MLLRGGIFTFLKTLVLRRKKTETITVRTVIARIKIDIQREVLLLSAISVYG